MREKHVHLRRRKMPALVPPEVGDTIRYDAYPGCGPSPCHMDRRDSRRRSLGYFDDGIVVVLGYPRHQIVDPTGQTIYIRPQRSYRSCRRAVGVCASARHLLGCCIDKAAHLHRLFICVEFAD